MAAFMKLLKYSVKGTVWSHNNHHTVFSILALFPGLSSCWVGRWNRGRIVRQWSLDIPDNAQDLLLGLLLKDHTFRAWGIIDSVRDGTWFWLELEKQLMPPNISLPLPLATSPFSVLRPKKYFKTVLHNLTKWEKLHHSNHFGENMIDDETSMCHCRIYVWLMRP